MGRNMTYDNQPNGNLSLSSDEFEVNNGFGENDVKMFLLLLPDFIFRICPAKILLIKQTFKNEQGEDIENSLHIVPKGLWRTYIEQTEKKNCAHRVQQIYWHFNSFMITVKLVSKASAIFFFAISVASGKLTGPTNLCAF
jgi:hypothetical protein